jgi:predicted ATPase
MLCDTDYRRVRAEKMMYPRLSSITIQGYRPFKYMTADFGPLDVLVGANGTGKTSLFEFLRFLRDGLYQEFPPEIVPGGIGQQVFHRPGEDRFWWSAEIAMDPDQWHSVLYEGRLTGPAGRARVTSERVRPRPVPKTEDRLPFLDVQEGSGVAVRDPYAKTPVRKNVEVGRPRQLALGLMADPEYAVLSDLRSYIGGWMFYSSFNVAKEKLRRSVVTQQEPVLNEDCGNLTAVLLAMQLEQPEQFDELQRVLRLAIPGFHRLSVKPRGGPGEVMTEWSEDGVDTPLNLADLSDGVLQLLCWTAFCLQPNPPTLACLDEPDQAVHPRTLPILAGLFDKASDRMQLLIATHNSYFMSQFGHERIGIFRKENGEAVFRRPSSSKALVALLEDFGPEEIEALHRSDELERLP